MVSRDPERYRSHAEKTSKVSGFVPIYADMEARHYNASGKDTTKLWLGEIIDTFQFITFELPRKDDPHYAVQFGTENLSGDKVDSRFPFGELSVTRISDSPNPDQVVVTLEIFMHDHEKAVKLSLAMDEEMFSIVDITGDGRTKFFNRFDQGVELSSDKELPTALTSKVESTEPPLFTSMKTSRIYNIGSRTAEFMLSDQGIFALENAAA